MVVVQVLRVPRQVQVFQLLVPRSYIHSSLNVNTAHVRLNTLYTRHIGFDLVSLEFVVKRRKGFLTHRQIVLPSTKSPNKGTHLILLGGMNFLYPRVSIIDPLWYSRRILWQNHVDNLSPKNKSLRILPTVRAASTRTPRIRRGHDGRR